MSSQALVQSLQTSLTDARTESAHLRVALAAAETRVRTLETSGDTRVREVRMQILAWVQFALHVTVCLSIVRWRHSWRSSEQTWPHRASLPRRCGVTCAPHKLMGKAGHGSVMSRPATCVTSYVMRTRPSGALFLPCTM